MLLSILSIFLGAIGASFLTEKFRKSAGILLSCIPFACFCYFLSLYTSIKNGEIITSNSSWVEILNINLSFYLDGLSMLFALLITGIGVLILIYSNGYMLHHEHKGKFYSFMLVFMGAMLGLVLAGNLITMYIFWELTSITSFLLIGFNHTKKAARSAALQALLVTELGGLALLAGIIIMGSITGSYEINDLLTQHGVLIRNPLYTPMLLLLLLGAFTKSAQFPFHFWLPSAMKAPTPVSAYLHSAAMVNAGIYLLARLTPVLGNTELWHNYVTLFGGITMLTGAYLSLTKKDLKAILAYVTISALGILMMLIGIGTYLSIKAALLYLIVHAFYKATLFMMTGAIDKKTGTRNIDKLGNLWSKMPVTMVISLLALLSMAGLPPMLGYISKEFIYEAGKQAPGIFSYLLIFSVLSNAFMVAISIIFAYGIFFRNNKHVRLEKVNETGISLWIGPAILATLSLVLALYAKPLEPLLEAALGSIKAVPIKVEVKLWHGVNLIFLLSIITIVSGVLIFWTRKFLLKWLSIINNRIFSLEFADIFSKLTYQLEKLARRSTQFLQHGYYRFYLIVILLITAGLVWFHLYLSWDWSFTEKLSEVSSYATALAIISAAAAVATIFTNSRMATIITMGVIGYCISLLYMIYGSVDLAITQAIVETLTLILFVMMFFKLPNFKKYLSPSSRLRDGFIAITVGGFMTALVLKSNKLSLNYPVSNYLTQHSFTEAHGKNIVNVILVDFRAFDTLGESIVLAIAALAIYAIFKYKIKKT